MQPHHKDTNKLNIINNLVRLSPKEHAAIYKSIQAFIKDDSDVKIHYIFDEIYEYEIGQKSSSTDDRAKAFHANNAELAKFAKLNVSRSIEQKDGLIYLLANLMYNHTHLSQDYKLYRKLLYLLAVPNLETHLYTVLFWKQMGNIQQVFFNIQNNLGEQKTIREMYLLSRVLLYDDFLLNCEVYYKNEMRPGFYVLFDVLCNELSRHMEKEQTLLWKEKFKDYCNTNTDVGYFYKELSKLQLALTFENTDIGRTKARNLLADVNILPFDMIEGKMSVSDLTLLHIMRLFLLNKLEDYKGIIDSCDAVLNGINSTGYQNRWFHDYICKYMADALNKIDGSEKTEWYYKLIKDFSISKIGNLVFLMPDLPNAIEEETVYHYSDVNSLKSIIDNKQLWLTRYDYLNDTEEVKFTFDIIKKYVSMNTGNPKDEFHAFLTDCISLLKIYFGEETFDIKPEQNKIVDEIKNSISKVYVLSTSLKDDNLSLWNYYSGGTGANIKFNTKTLKLLAEYGNNSVQQMSANIFMKKIDYLNLIDYESIIEKLRCFFYNCAELIMEQKRYLGCINILFEGIFKKNANMTQEQEYRFVLIVPNHDVSDSSYSAIRINEKYRVKNNAFVIPYIELNIEPRVLIEGIKIAPLNKTDIAKRGLVDFLKAHNHKNADKLVELSEIKLRY